MAARPKTANETASGRVLDSFGKPVFRVRLLAESLEKAAGLKTVNAGTRRQTSLLNSVMSEFGPGAEICPARQQGDVRCAGPNSDFRF